MYQEDMMKTVKIPPMYENRYLAHSLGGYKGIGI